MIKQFKPSREMYRKIKRMDSTELGAFLTSIYEEGFNAALENTNNITVEDLRNAIGTVKGIGDKRMQDINEAINKLFDESGIEYDQ